MLCDRIRYFYYDVHVCPSLEMSRAKSAKRVLMKFYFNTLITFDTHRSSGSSSIFVLLFQLNAVKQAKRSF